MDVKKQAMSQHSDYNEALNRMAQERIDRNLQQTQADSLVDWETKEQAKLAEEGIREEEWYVDVWNSGKYLEVTEEDRMYIPDENKKALSEFPSGALREPKEGKGRYDLISPVAMRRLALTLERGAKLHGDRNWERGMPISTYLQSALRHIFQYLDGMIDEDHLSAAFWNLMAAMHTEEKHPELVDIVQECPF